MTATFPLSILAASGVFYQGECESLVVPVVDGQYGVLAHHSNVISAVIPGELQYQPPGQNKLFAAVSSGLMKIEDGAVLVLVDSAERPEEIDVNRAQRDADAAREELLQKMSRQEYRATQARLARAINRIRVRERHMRGR